MIRDIFNTYREAFRLWVRNRTRPKTIVEAEEKRLFWSKCYLLSVTCAVGIYIFQSYREGVNFGNDKNTPMPLRLAREISKTEPVRFVKYSAFKLVSDKPLNVNDIENDNILKEEGTSVPKVS